MNQQFVVGALQKLEACDTLDERWISLGDLLAELGFDQINYALLNTAEGPRDTASVTQFSTMDRTWIGHYLDRRLDLTDPHVRFVREYGWKPYLFDETMADRLEGGEREVIRQAAEAGLRAQLSVVFPDLAGQSPDAGMSIGTSEEPTRFAAALEGNEMALMVIAMYFHSLSVREIHRARMGVEALSGRERDVLNWIASGLRVGRIAEKMRISEVTVELHLRRARQKLKAKTTAQAVARAIMLGEVVF